MLFTLAGLAGAEVRHNKKSREESRLCRLDSLRHELNRAGQTGRMACLPLQVTDGTSLSYISKTTNDYRAKLPVEPDPPVDNPLDSRVLKMIAMGLSELELDAVDDDPFDASELKRDSSELEEFDELDEFVSAW